MNKSVLEKTTGRIEMMKRDAMDIKRLFRLAGCDLKIDNPNIPLNINEPDIDADELLVLELVEDLREKVNTLHTLTRGLLMEAIKQRHRESEGGELTYADHEKGFFLTHSRGSEPEDEVEFFGEIYGVPICQPARPEFATIGLVD